MSASQYESTLALTGDSNPNTPDLLFDALPLHWQMTRWEKYGLDAVLRTAKAPVAIEVGTYQGGSLQLIAKHATKAYSIDISPQYREQLSKAIPNAVFRTGDAKMELPRLLEEIQQGAEDLGFVLIDGDHSEEGVRTDLNAVLAYTPVRPLFVVLHDSFNPACRKGILSADWSSPYVHFAEIDFVPGVFHAKAFDTAEAGSMYGGLALIIMQPTQRTGLLTVHQCQEGLFDAVFLKSIHARPPHSPGLLRRTARWLRRKMVNAKGPTA